MAKPSEPDIEIGELVDVDEPAPPAAASETPKPAPEAPPQPTRPVSSARASDTPRVKRKSKKRRHRRSGGKVGQPFFVPTDEHRARVWAAAANNMDQHEIARAVINPQTKRPIDVTTLRRYFPEECATAKALFKTEIAVKLVNALRSGHTNSTAIFLSKAHLGLREKTEIVGDDGGPIQVQNVEMTEADRAQQVSNIVSIAEARAKKRAAA